MRVVGHGGRDPGDSSVTKAHTLVVAEVTAVPTSCALLDIMVLQIVVVDEVDVVFPKSVILERFSDSLLPLVWWITL